MFEFLWFILYIYCAFICFVIFLHLLEWILLPLILGIVVILCLSYSVPWLPGIIIYFIITIYYLSKFIKFAYQKIMQKIKSKK
jgi:hypothetical protein